MPKTYTVKQVAEALGVSTNTVYKYLEEGKISATRLNAEGRFHIQESEVVKLTGTPISPSPQTVTVLPSELSPLPPPAKTYNRFVQVLVITLTAALLSVLSLYSRQIGSLVRYSLGQISSLDLEKEISSVTLNEEQLLSARVIGGTLGTIILPDNTFASYKVIAGLLTL